MLKRSVKKTTNEQFELLKFEMSKHPAAAIGYGVGTDRGKVDAEWREIIVKLNAIGPPHRTVTEWKKVWSDVRLRMKKRLNEQYSGKSRKNRKIKEESESEEDFLMESLNSTNSIYASNSCLKTDDYEMSKISHETSPPPSRVNAPHEDYTVQRQSDEDYQQPAVATGNNSVEEEDNHRSVKKTTSQQFELLKFEMSKHPAAAMGYCAGTDRNKVDADWREIIVKLNAIGPPHRTVTEWKKVWSDVRLRIKKRIGEQCRRKNRKRKDESESEEDLLMEALNSSIYASRSCPDNEDYDENEIAPEPCPSLVNVSLDEDYHKTSTVNESCMSSATVVKSNPLEETELPDISDSKNHYAHQQRSIVDNNPLEEENLTEFDGRKHLHRDFGNSDLAESHYNSNARNSFMEHTLYTLQSQMEQHNKLLDHLSRISASVSGIMERQVAVMERRTQLMERQTKASEYHDFLRRRQETRKKMRGTTFKWF